MAYLIDKSALVSEINKRIIDAPVDNIWHQRIWAYNDVKDIIETLEVIDPYELLVQYPSVNDAIQAHAEIYSFNIESELFSQLTKEQQKLWREEIEEACISGGNAGYLLAKDTRYKENLEVKEVDFEKELQKLNKEIVDDNGFLNPLDIAKHFFELGLKTQKGE